MSPLIVDSPLCLTGHPLQRCGARAVAVLAGAERPEDVTPAGLASVADKLTGDIVRAAAAAKTAVAYDWWKVLYALYPNSPATHSTRGCDPTELRASVECLFAHDPAGSITACAFCDRPAGVLWG